MIAGKKSGYHQARQVPFDHAKRGKPSSTEVAARSHHVAHAENSTMIAGKKSGYHQARQVPFDQDEHGKPSSTEFAARSHHVAHADDSTMIVAKKNEDLKQRTSGKSKVHPEIKQRPTLTPLERDVHHEDQQKQRGFDTRGAEYYAQARFAKAYAGSLSEIYGAEEQQK